mmetsp:Transcript_20856/g.39160  ORF Transcript_20856/g.39160 Transcript_20856/m.39160 type:complete len:85 (+) Transcript_20856:467-721(+)
MRPTARRPEFSICFKEIDDETYSRAVAFAFTVIEYLAAFSVLLAAIYHYAEYQCYGVERGAASRFAISDVACKNLEYKWKKGFR